MTDHPPARPEDLAIAPELYELADRWKLYPDNSERPCGVIHPPVVIDGEYQMKCGRIHRARVFRCRKCREEVFPADETGILRHLVTTHGYRMNGRRYDNKNREVPWDD